MTRPHDEMLEHEFDGIREYDNPPPGWIMWMLYTSIVFAVGYWLYYQTFAVGHQPTKNYEAEMARAAEVQLEKMAKQELSDATLQLMAAVPAQVDEGRKIFEQFCVVCHGAGGEGNVGPNLTDPYWIHGGAPMSIWKTVTNGVTDKGMAAWAGQLGPTRVQKVVAFVITLKDTNRPGKAPQGEVETAAPGAPAAAAGSAPAVAAPASAPAQARS
jgi:cytochrome c oxidase cbb3-type subunit III